MDQLHSFSTRQLAVYKHQHLKALPTANAHDLLCKQVPESPLRPRDVDQSRYPRAVPPNRL